jgi:hypothetical protein
LTGVDLQDADVKIANLPEEFAPEVDSLWVSLVIKADAAGKEREDIGVIPVEIPPNVGAGEIEEELPRCFYGGCCAES